MPIAAGATPHSDVRNGRLAPDAGLPSGLNGWQTVAAGQRRDLTVVRAIGGAGRAVAAHGHREPGMQVPIEPFVPEAPGIRDAVGA